MMSRTVEVEAEFLTTRLVGRRESLDDVCS
jgi:hypothetical protein